ncbi:DUF6071 family protein [Dactylosporangium sp. CA-139066]|uniref:DUF6071 family protein n=1 Tax=Dactylosporangium sp. CA-139066 TaxID=3239930 RepID=UPI003D8ED7C9
MARLLVANGCSLTRGAELAHPEREAWPAVLGDRLGITVVNLGCDGGSNRRVVRTSVATFERACRDAGVATEDALFVGMWTGLDRSEYLRTSPADSDPGNRRDVRPRLPYEASWFRTATWRLATDAGSEAYYRHLWSEEGGTMNFVLDWLLLDGYLRARGATARYVYGWDVLDSLPRPVAPPLRELADLVDRSAVYGREVLSSDTSFYSISRAGEFSFGPGRHPLAPAHAHFAGLLADWCADT